MKSLEASPEGADKLRQARDESGRTVDSPRWLEESSKVLNSAWKLGDYYAEGVNEGSWRRFLYRVRPIKAEIFKAYCQVLGVPYQEVVEVLMKDDGFIVPEGETVSIPNLDGATIRWVGREDLVEKLVQRLLGDCRLLMLVGLTGIGKTALAARLLTDRLLSAAQTWISTTMVTKISWSISSP